MSTESLVVIILLGAVTYATRFGGHLILARFGALHPRVEAGLDAVPGAVIAALVAPGVFAGSLPEYAAAVAVILACARLPMLAAIALSLVVLVALRSVLG